MLWRRLVSISIAGLTGIILLMGFFILAARPATAVAADGGDFAGAIIAYRQKAQLVVPEMESTQICSSPWLNIPDNNPAGVTDSIVLENLGTITDLDVYLQVSHTWVGDLLISLEHENTGNSAVLVDRPGVPASSWGCSSNNIDVTVNDQGLDIPIENQCKGWAPAIHGDAPGGDPPGPVLEIFNDENTAGTWTLTAADLSVNDVGELMEWCLNVTAVLEPDIAVSPSSLNSTQEVDTQVTQPLTISNLGNADLTWTITEEGGIPTIPVLEAPVSQFVAGTLPDSAGPAPEDGTPTALTPEWDPPNPLSGPAYGWNWNHGQYYTAFDLATPDVLPNTASFPAPGDFIGAGEVVDGRVWMIDFQENLYELDPDTGQILSTKSVTPPMAGHNYSGMALDPTNGLVYLSSTSVGKSNLYTLDLSTGIATLVGPIWLSPSTIAIAIDGNGILYGADITKNALLEIDKATGNTSLVGNLGFDANYGQGMAWDPATDILFMAAYNGATFRGELRTIDRTTGRATFIKLLGATSPGGQNQLGWVGVDLAVEGCAAADISWLSVDPTAGTTLSETNSLVDVTYDSTGLIPDVYTGTLCIESNDPDTPLVRVPVTLTVTEVLTPTPGIALTKTVGLDPAVCATTDNIAINPGDSVTYCYTAQNTGDVTLTLHDLEDSDLGTIFVGLPFTLTPGASVFVTQSLTPQTSTVNVGLWTSCNLTSGPGGGGCASPDATAVVTATDVATVTVTVPQAEILMTKTVGLDPAVCSSGDILTVPQGTEVTFCYTVVNSGDIVLTVHDLVDNDVGTILSGFFFNLGPGDSTFVTATVRIFTDTENVAAWTACNNPPEGFGCGPGATDIVFAIDAATVNVIPGIPDIDLSHTILTANVQAGLSVIRELVVSNVGLGFLNWSIDEEAPPDSVSEVIGEYPPFVAGNSADSAGPAPLDGVPTGQPQPAGFNILGVNGEGSTAYGWNWNHGQYYTVWDLTTPEILPNTQPFPAPGDFIGAGEFVDGKIYMIDFNENLYELDPATGAVLSTKSLPHPGPGQSYSGMALDPTSGVVYLSSTSVGKSHLYTVDLAAGTVTFIGHIANAPGIIAIAIDGSGTLYAADIINNALLTLDKTTGEADLIGALGFDANFGQGMAWDPGTDTLFMAAYNGSIYRGELRTVNRSTGYAAFVGLLGSSSPGGQNQLGWVAVDLAQDCAPGDLPWLFVNPGTGTSPAGSGVPVEVTFSARTFSAGVYTGAICVSSNDPDEPIIRVPLIMTVSGSLPVEQHFLYLPTVIHDGNGGNQSQSTEINVAEMVLIQSSPIVVLALFVFGRSYRRRREEVSTY